jgi:hypothetical protein
MRSERKKGARPETLPAGENRKRKQGRNTFRREKNNEKLKIKK